MGRRSFAVLVLAGTLVAACHRTKSYDAKVEVTRTTPVRKDEAGKVVTLDLEYTFSDCPGAQVEVIRGDAAFAACAGKYKVGEKIPIKLDHQWDPEGHYEWVVRRVGDCAREPDPNDEASFALVRECEDWAVNGTRVGFECKYIPEKKLLEKCPWFRRH